MAPRRPLQRIVDLTDHFRHLPLWAILGLLSAAGALVAWAWNGIWVGLGWGLFVAGDGVMLAALPRFGRSYGPPQLPLLSLAALRLTLALIATFIGGAWSLLSLGLLQVALSLAATYACWVEPARLGVTQIRLRFPRLDGCPPLRLLHLSDLHLERITNRERQLLRLAQRLAPDVIVVTGDYLNISCTHDALAQRQARALLGQLRAPGGVYVVTGSPPVDPPAVLARLFEGLDLTWLRDQATTLAWHGCELQIAGVECSYDVEADAHRLERLLNGREAEAFTLLLYHTPDVMPAAVRAGVDLYLAGHTHGGQLRLPFLGALVTASKYGKRYEMGLYREGRTRLYVSRGVGLEGKGAPRARFLCPPEIVLFTLVGAEN